MIKWSRWWNEKSLFIRSISDIFFDKKYNHIITNRDMGLYIDNPFRIQNGWNSPVNSD
jgi:hypothetical protein